MKKIIVTTTINEPTEALIKFSKMQDWDLIVVGDIKTPHDKYKNINCLYLHPDEQEKKYKELSDSLGWKTIQRRNIGFVEAYNLGADIIATVDDDNIPYDDWGKNLYVNQTINVDTYETKTEIADPLSVTNNNDLWHRGFPLELLKEKNFVEYLGKRKKEVLIQADLWDGDPDVDAICRLSKKPIVKFDTKEPFCFTKISPFNSQNTFLSRKIIPFYMMIPFVGRMDDIWGAYIVQKKFSDNLIFNKATVYQQRNVQDLVKNLENEIIGYRNTLKFLKEGYNMPIEAEKSFQIYRKQFGE